MYIHAYIYTYIYIVPLSLYMLYIYYTYYIFCFVLTSVGQLLPQSRCLARRQTTNWHRESCRPKPSRGIRAKENPRLSKREEK